MSGGNLVSKRTTRIFVEDNESCGAENTTKETPRLIAQKQEKEQEKEDRNRWSSASSVVHSETPPDMGADLIGNGMVLCDFEDLEEKVSQKLQVVKEKDSDDIVEKKPHFNFGEVIPGCIYRSSFPQTDNFQFLQTLGLKTILSLVNKDFPHEFKNFMKANDINHKIIDMPGTKKVAISEAVMNSIMDVVLDKQNYPLLIHCNHGRHRTGCAVAVIRHVYGNAISSIEAEYRYFAGEKPRECDIKYINEYQITSLHHLFVIKEEKHEEQRVLICRTTKMERFIVIAAISLVVWLATLYLFPTYEDVEWSQY